MNSHSITLRATRLSFSRIIRFMNLFQDRIETAVNSKIAAMDPLTGGCIGEVYRVDLANGRSVVSKMAAGGHGRLDIEGQMLRHLDAHSILPVPEVILSEPDLLIMSYIEGESRFDANVEADAAEKLAALHNLSSKQFGFEYDTLTGGLRQPNSWADSWLTFFGEQRLIHMANQCVAVNRLPIELLRRLSNLVEQLDQWLVEPERPSLIHGDVWTTNVLARNGRIAGFVDPAIYYADPEIELAFITLFDTFGAAFFERYGEIRPLRPGFFEERRDLYNLYPLLTHVRLFGGSYVSAVERILEQFGY